MTLTRLEIERLLAVATQHARAMRTIHTPAAQTLEREFNDLTNKLKSISLEVEKKSRSTINVIP